MKQKKNLEITTGTHTGPKTKKPHSIAKNLANFEQNVSTVEVLSWHFSTWKINVTPNAHERICVILETCLVTV